jgi:hypothetical protein
MSRPPCWSRRPDPSTGMGLRMAGRQARHASVVDRAAFTGDVTVPPEPPGRPALSPDGRLSAIEWSRRKRRRFLLADDSGARQIITIVLHWTETITR